MNKKLYPDCGTEPWMSFDYDDVENGNSKLKERRKVIEREVPRTIPRHDGAESGDGYLSILDCLRRFKEEQESKRIQAVFRTNTRMRISPEELSALTRMMEVFDQLSDHWGEQWMERDFIWKLRVADQFLEILRDNTNKGTERSQQRVAQSYYPSLKLCCYVRDSVKKKGRGYAIVRIHPKWPKVPQTEYPLFWKYVYVKEVMFTWFCLRFFQHGGVENVKEMICAKGSRKNLEWPERKKFWDSAKKKGCSVMFSSFVV